MSVPVKRYLRRTNLSDPNSSLKYYLRQEAGSYKVITMEKIAQRMERVGSLTAQDALHTIQNFIIELRNELVEGNRVKVDGLGTFHITFSCDGSEEEKDCTVKKIKQVKVKFFVENSLRLVNESIATTRGAQNNVQFYIKGESAAATNNAVVPDGGNGGGDDSGSGGGDDDDFVDPGA